VAKPSGAEGLARRAAKPVMWVLCLLPLALILWDGFHGGLSAEPIKEVTHRTGKTALILLMVTLAVTPLRGLGAWNYLVQLRRPLGLFAFFYAVLHFSIYLIDQGFDPGFIVEDIVKHPYVTVGFAALLLLVPLAVTSTKASIKRLGGKRWQRLHRLVYVAAGLGVVHFYWLVKKDVREPLIFAAVFATLMAFRLPLLKRRPQPAPRARAPRDAPAREADRATG
jgi:sulfoxide reductase heme-binding subunit YedZ